MKTTTATAKYKGEDKFLGLKNGSSYNIEISQSFLKGIMVYVKLIDGVRIITHGNIHSFLKNWSNVKSENK